MLQQKMIKIERKNFDPIFDEIIFKTDTFLKLVIKRFFCPI